MSGVGTLLTSMRSILPVAAKPRSTERPEIPDVATSAPSVVMTVPLEGMPRIEANEGDCGLRSCAMPGIALRNSPTLPSPMSFSIAMTFLIFGAFFRSCNATAWVVSSEAWTVNFSSTRPLESFPAASPEPKTSSKSFVASLPAVTVTVATCDAIPENEAVTRALPTGTAAKRYSPFSPVRVSSRVPWTTTRAWLR